MANLTKKQKIFVSEYLIDLNATQAAIRAGYSKKTAMEQGYQILQRTSVQDAIQDAMRNREQRTQITQDKVVNELAKIAFAKFTDFAEYKTLLRITEYDDDGNPVYDWVPTVIVKDSTEVDSSAIQEVSVGRDGTFKFKLYSKLDALEKLGRHTGLYDSADKNNRDAEDREAIANKLLEVLREQDSDD